MKFTKRIERSGKRLLRKILKIFLKPVPLEPEDFDRDSISSVLVVRQDSRLGNLVLMTPLISGLRTVFPDARLDVLISEGFEEMYRLNPEIDNLIVFQKKKARVIPWQYLRFIHNLRKNKYDLAVDVSNGYHFSLNNVLLTSLSGAKYRLGYDRDDAKSFLNILAPLPPEETHITDAMLGLIKFISPGLQEFPLSFYVSESDRSFAKKWLNECNIRDFDSFFVIHPGGRGKKQWGAENFAELIGRIDSDISARIVVIVGEAEDELIDSISELTDTAIEIIQNITICQMAAVIESCDMFISNDTGPMHVSSALGRPTVGIFISSDFRIYGLRGKNGRTVISKKEKPSVDDVMMAVLDLLGINDEMKE